MIERAGSSAATLESLLGEGYSQVEVYEKSSRSRGAAWEPDRLSISGVEERGWAVRASDGEGSIHVAGTGVPPVHGPWPGPIAPPLELPGVETASARPTGVGGDEEADTDDLDAPLLAEGEVVALLRAVADRLAAEASRARLLRAVLEDGVAEVAIHNSHGVRAGHRARVATLDLWAARGDRDTRISVAAREPRRLAVGALARRLADQLVVLGDGETPQAQQGPAVLAGEVVAGVLESLRPLWLEPGGWGRLEQCTDEGGRFGSPAVTIVDDGRLRGGLLAAPIDGEGVATGRVVLVEAGQPRGTLRSWREPGPGEPIGCVRRPGWRDQPRPGPSHLFLEPDPGVAVRSLVEELGAGTYLLGLEGAPRVDWTERSLALPVYGFAIGKKGASRPIRGGLARASIPAFFGGIVKAARDLRFGGASGGCVGAPSVLIEELEVEPG